MRFLTIMLLLISIESYGSGCAFSDKQLIEYSAKYSSSITVLINKRDDDFHIVVEIPSMLDESSFKGASIVKKESATGKYVLVLPLSVVNKEDTMIGWFNINKMLFSNLHLYIDYGEGCGFSIKKTIEK